MPITIKYQKLVSFGEKIVEILEIDALGISDLPDEYLTGSGDCVLLESLEDRPTLRLVNRNGHTNFLRQGRTYDTKYFFEEALPVVRRAGRRLRDINRRRRQQEWQGVEEVKI